MTGAIGKHSGLTGKPEAAKETEVVVVLPQLLLENGYYYTQLSEREQRLYGTILRALEETAADVPVDAEEEMFKKVFQCVLNDHPEIFYVDGYTFIYYKEGNRITGKAFSGSYIYSKKEIAEKAAQIEEKVRAILTGIPAGSSEYEKVRYVYEYLVRHTEYVLESEDNQNICSVFLNGSSVCQGYAKAAQYLLEELGMDAILVSGTVDGGEEHAWNLVKIDGVYYHMDITWGDASYVSGGSIEGYEGKIPQINYEYLCVPDEEVEKTHRIVGDVPVPVCDSMAANYYVMEGAYFTEVDLEKAEALFERAYEKQNEYVTMKCADEAVYQEMEKRLIRNQEVFRYLHAEDGVVAYTLNEQQRALSFWLQD